MTTNADEMVTEAAKVQAEGRPGVLVSTHRPWRDIADETLRHLARSPARHVEFIRMQRTEDGTPVIEHIAENAPRGQMNPDGMNAHSTLDRPGIVHNEKVVE
jgi:hypothetical protein